MQIQIGYSVLRVITQRNNQAAPKLPAFWLIGVLYFIVYLFANLEEPKNNCVNIYKNIYAYLVILGDSQDK